MNDQEVVFDVDALLAWVEGDRELLEELAHDFAAEVPRWLGDLRVAVSAGDAPTTYRLAHSVKGAVSNLGAPGVRAAAADLETMARAAEMGTAAVTLDRLERGLHALSAFLGGTPWRQTEPDPRPT